MIQGDDINFYIESPNGNEIYHLNNEKKGFYQISKTLLPANTDLEGKIEETWFDENN